jgi:hypothetical protein
MKANKYVEQYIALNFQPIPVSRHGDGKGCYIDEWEKKEFKADDFKESDNIGLNLKLSKLNNFDPDSENARIQGKLFQTFWQQKENILKEKQLRSCVAVAILLLHLRSLNPDFLNMN